MIPTEDKLYKVYSYLCDMKIPEPNTLAGQERGKLWQDEGMGSARVKYAKWEAGLSCFVPQELYALILTQMGVQFCFYFQAVRFDLRSIVWFEGGPGHPSDSLPRCPLEQGAQGCTLKCWSGIIHVQPNWWVQGLWWGSSSTSGYNCKYFSVTSG